MTPYELFNGRAPAIGFLKPFGCHVMILNTLGNLGKFEAKGDEGTKDAAKQEVRKNESSQRYILLPNWAHDALLESTSKPKRVYDALQDSSWVEAMQEELLQFKIQKVWTLVDCPKGVRPIGTKWVLKNKKDERGIMDVKSAFLYGTIDEEVYVMQPPGFHDPEYAARVYKVEKAMYGLHQAPRA
nr:hypothetical protein [Tanacetum cinerariifolium]